MCAVHPDCIHSFYTRSTTTTTMTTTTVYLYIYSIRCRGAGTVFEPRGRAEPFVSRYLPVTTKRHPDFFYELKACKKVRYYILRKNTYIFGNLTLHHIQTANNKRFLNTYFNNKINNYFFTRKSIEDIDLVRHFVLSYNYNLLSLRNYLI